MTEEQRIDAEKVDQKKKDDDFIELLALPSFRRWMNWMFEQTRPLTSAYVLNGVDGQRESDRQTGKREIGLMLLSRVLDVAPDKYTQMLREYRSAMVVKEIVRKNTED